MRERGGSGKRSEIGASSGATLECEDRGMENELSDCETLQC